jgi:hypothetical protein
MLAMWACGCTAMLLVIAIRSRRIARRIDRSSSPPPQALIDLVQATCQSLGLRRRPTVRLCQEAVGPAIFGTFRPALVLPAVVSEESRLSQLRIIVVHELVHLRRRDPLVAGVQLLSQSVWWFHPLVWWMNREISLAREMCCDAQAISKLECPAAEYAQTLIDVLRLRRRFTAIPLSLGIKSAQVSARRLDQIMSDAGFSNRRMSWPHWALLLACAHLLLPGAGIWSPGTALGQTDTQPADSNKALYDFLGQPVAPPEDLNPMYTKEGLTNAVQLAAKKAGVSLKKVEIDDSEFPFLVGVVCNSGDCDKLNEPLGKLPGYIYGGSTSSGTIKAMNITPRLVYPQQDRDRIERRLMVRMQVLYYKILAEPPADAKVSPDQNAGAAPASQP